MERFDINISIKYDYSSGLMSSWIDLTFFTRVYNSMHQVNLLLIFHQKTSSNFKSEKWSRIRNLESPAGLIAKKLEFFSILDHFLNDSIFLNSCIWISHFERVFPNEIRQQQLSLLEACSAIMTHHLLKRTKQAILVEIVFRAQKAYIFHVFSGIIFDLR